MLSGTSCDAVDVAAVRLWFEPAADGGEELVLRPLGLHSEPFPGELRRELLAVLPPARVDLAAVCRLDTGLGRFFGGAAARAAAVHADAADGGARLVVSHGQTVYHWVEGPRALGTLQLGAPAYIAEATGLPVVSDLRSRDIARGGHGAPLAAMLDGLLLPDDGTPRGALNLGGIANLTVRDGAGHTLAWDVGPANALIDAVATEDSGGAERMDTGGRRAARGTVDRALLDRLLDEPYYALPAPKSTGKELFHAGYLRRFREGTGGPGTAAPGSDDLAATVTELTAELVAGACRDHALTEVVASGGGVRNPVLMARIAALAPGVRFTTSEEYGLPSQAKEGCLFALLGFLSVHGLPGSVPSATGASSAAVLGSLTPGDRPLRLPDPRAAGPRRLRVVR
ncbi:anhydro-N-acetylmuramic acid kinase [Streptomyces otsuchiensis]|uniref:anhydro-N-acetylmuramic acid kinase n=1 Tax=Streptomyces otsuchiensis TaxID=2681388 RepID=UPI001031AC8E|nr:anhydro-N-acetylmuramic acid kinase [Streptomyces otsuchiensis]